MTASAHRVIQSFYEAVNRRDIPAAMDLVDDDCLYQDLNFPHPFQGKEAVQKLLEDSCKGMPNDLQFVIDDITEGDPLAVGVLWHVELGGAPFPNGRGASFCRVSEKTGKLVFARDLVEPPFKPGDAAFFIIRLVTPLIRRQLKGKQRNSEDAIAPSSQLGASQPRLSVVLWMLSAAYLYLLLLSPPGQLIPGEPAWAIQPDTLREVIDESINFFFILPILNGIGMMYMKAPTVNPVTEALFNFAEAWIFMFLPLLLADKRGRNLPKVPIWGMAMFLTNVFLTPYMALRAAAPAAPSQEKCQKGRLARGFGWTGVCVGAIALTWVFIGRPEFGGLTERAQYFGEQLMTNRVTVAFCVDLVLFTVFQAVLMGAVEPLGSQARWLRFIPFWGLAIWLII
ncbi:MAG: nuclear transport factor 2 family protein [Leptolyngbyaceae cyanobacterium MO_188.B28]|nr:nuclear transport factor 2 family protein [Leptolyngbyaceae cyanobacterium MO_188.B28]